jgi:hypothetical protein
MRIEILVTGFTPPAGVFRVGDVERGFYGWLELLGLLSQLLEAQLPTEPIGGPGGKLDPGGQT